MLALLMTCEVFIPLNDPVAPPLTFAWRIMVRKWMTNDVDSQFTTWRRTIWTGAGLIISAGGVLVALISSNG